MATNTLISPGVLELENDQSFIAQQPVTVGAAIIGPTVKGPVEVPTIVPPTETVTVAVPARPSDTTSNEGFDETPANLTK